MSSSLNKSSIVAALLISSIAPSISYAGSGTGGGGDPKAIEFLSYARYACRWMAGDDHLQQYSQKCMSTSVDIEESLGSKDRTARLEFVPDELTDDNGVSKPAVTSKDGRVHVNQAAWISMTPTDRVRVAVMEMSLLSEVDMNRYSDYVGGKIGGAWNIEHGGNRPLSDIPVGTRLFGYRPITIPANTNTVVFPSLPTETVKNFTEISLTDGGFSEVHATSDSEKVQNGHVFSLGNTQHAPETAEEYCSFDQKSNIDNWKKVRSNCLSLGSYGDILKTIGLNSTVGLPGFQGVTVIMPNTETQDMTIQNLTVIGIEKIQEVANGGQPGYTTLDGLDSQGAKSYMEVVLDAVTDVNPKSIVKIVSYINYWANVSYVQQQPANTPVISAGLTLNLLSLELQRHFAIVFPEPKAE